MKPRGLPASWQRSRHCLTYAFDLGQPSRMQERRDALAYEYEADSRTTGGPDMSERWLPALQIDANGPHKMVVFGRERRPYESYLDDVQVGDVIFCYDDHPSLNAGRLVRVTEIRPGHGDPTSKVLKGDVIGGDRLDVALALLANYEASPTRSAAVATVSLTWPESA